MLFLSPSLFDPLICWGHVRACYSRLRKQHWTNVSPSPISHSHLDVSFINSDFLLIRKGNKKKEGKVFPAITTCLLFFPWNKNLSWYYRSGERGGSNLANCFTSPLPVLSPLLLILRHSFATEETFPPAHIVNHPESTFPELRAQTFHQ